MGYPGNMRSEIFTCVSYCMVCAYVPEDSPRAKAIDIKARELSPVHMHKHTITVLLHQHEYARCAL